MPITLAAASMCTLDMNGTTVNLTSLTTTSGLTDFNFADPTTGNDLLSVPGGGLTVNPNTYLSFGTEPTAPGTYELIADTIDAFTLGNFILPTAPAGVSYSLAQDVSGNVDLVVAAARTRDVSPLGRWIDEPAGHCLAATQSRLGTGCWGLSQFSFDEDGTVPFEA